MDITKVIKDQCSPEDAYDFPDTYYYFLLQEVPADDYFPAILNYVFSKSII